MIISVHASMSINYDLPIGKTTENNGTIHILEVYVWVWLNKTSRIIYRINL